MSNTQTYERIAKSIGIDPVPSPTEPELVKNPDHYQAPFNPNLTVDMVIDGWGLDFWVGNVVKYLLRAGRKGTVVDAYRDLAKAEECASRAVNQFKHRNPEVGEG